MRQSIPIQPLLRRQCNRTGALRTVGPNLRNVSRVRARLYEHACVHANAFTLEGNRRPSDLAYLIRSVPIRSDRIRSFAQLYVFTWPRRQVRTSHARLATDEQRFVDVRRRCHRRAPEGHGRLSRVMGLRVLGLRRQKGRSSHTTRRNRVVRHARWRTARHVARKIQRDMPVPIAVVRCRNMAGL